MSTQTSSTGSQNGGTTPSSSASGCRTYRPSRSTSSGLSYDLPGGRVAFVDEDDRGTANDDIHFIANVPVAPRIVRDGRRFDVVKVFWDPSELQDRLSSLGWHVAVRRVGETFLYGSGA